MSWKLLPYKTEMPPQLNTVKHVQVPEEINRYRCTPAYLHTEGSWKVSKPAIVRPKVRSERTCLQD